MMWDDCGYSWHYDGRTMQFCEERGNAGLIIPGLKSAGGASIIIQPEWRQWLQSPVG